MNITKWVFEAELKNLAESCIGLKKDTARRKASKLFKLFEPLINYHVSDRKNQETKIENYRNALDTLKTGNIRFNKGCIKLDDIAQVQFDDNLFSIYTKSGREMQITGNIEYLKLIFLE